MKQTSSRTRRAPSGGDLHRAWLELVDTDGPFLAVPALRRVWPVGMPEPDADRLAALREARPMFERAWEEHDRRPDTDDALDLYRKARDVWVDAVLGEVLGWDVPLPAGPDVAVRSPDHAVTVRPTGALAYGDRLGALLLVVDPVDSLRDPLDDGWATSAIDRIDELLRRCETATLGVVTDGRWWALVSAREKTPVASGIVDALTWTEEPATRNAILEVLRPDRVLGGAEADRLPAIFAESVAAAEEITEALGVQVRRAVELLVQALSEGGLAAIRRGERDPLPARRAEVYEAAVTVMMRTVFLLFAEERGLLPQSQLFAMGYGVSDQLVALDRRANEETDESLDATAQTWHRLLATSRALFCGASFEDLRLPAYGGSLFAPTRFPFLTARDARGALAVTVSDRVMLEVLRAVQIAQLKGEPARPISFRDIDVEQIGYIYEGLLGYSCASVDQVVVGLLGTPGEEPEVPLRVLEELWHRHRGVDARVRELLAWVKADQPAAKPPSTSALTKAVRTADQVEDAERSLRQVTDDEALRDRLRPFVGVIRRDLRCRPLVVEPGGVVVVETPSRATSGAHYTPRSLAEEVVEHALAPLVYFPGPHQQPDGWELRRSWEILELKVADIACGSGAFLVAAARYLASRVVEAWREEKNVVGTPHEQQVHAIRAVVASSLYGADINAMAVEMCKLSLWLVSLDPKLPFSFVDDKVLHGNSLLGVTDIEQIRHLHIDPAAASQQLDVLGVDIDKVLDRAKQLRRSLATEVNDSDPQRSATNKRRQWADYQQLTKDLTDIADGVIAAGLRLGGKPGKTLDEAYENLRIAIAKAHPADGSNADRAMIEEIQEAGLTPTTKTDYSRWKPLHWAVQVPDVVVDRGGFDSIVGNPPFHGGTKISTAAGTNYREWQVHQTARGRFGSADLIAYFFLRAFELAGRPHSTLGMIATNTVAQSVTREVGLDQMVTAGFTITRSFQSQPWPSGPHLEFAKVWGTRSEIGTNAPRVSENKTTERGITTLLEPRGRVDGKPFRLFANTGIAFAGVKIFGPGFVLSNDEKNRLLEQDEECSEVIYPYPKGKEDINGRPDLQATRWVINFGDLSEKGAASYREAFARVRDLVRPVRARATSSYSKRVREVWWQYEAKREGLARAVRGLDRVIVIVQTSSTLAPALVHSNQVFDQKLVVFASNDASLLGELASTFHQLWAITWGPTRTADPVYTATDVFETFPRPRPSIELSRAGGALDVVRRELMLRRQLGLTKLYNLVHDPDIVADPDVTKMRELQVELDHAVMAAYGWEDLELDHGFHTYRQMRRWTVRPAARVEILDRLLEENHRRAAAQGEAPPPTDSDTGDEAVDA